MPYSPQHSATRAKKSSKAHGGCSTAKAMRGIDRGDHARGRHSPMGASSALYRKDALYARRCASSCAARSRDVAAAQRKPKMTAKPQALRVADAYFSRADFRDHDGCCRDRHDGQRGSATAKLPTRRCGAAGPGVREAFDGPGAR